MIASDATASMMPTMDESGAGQHQRRTDSTVTYAASAKNDNAMKSQPAARATQAIDAGTATG